MSLTKVIVSALILMMVGTALELVLLSHYETLLQLIPIIGIGLLMLNAVILFFRRSKIIKSSFKLLLILTALSGFYGSFLHLRANYEFALELNPTADIWYLVLESFTGAFPALAPLSMLVLTLISYSYLILINKKQ